MTINYNRLQTPVSYKKYKLFLVEEGDEDRERVLSATVNSYTVKNSPEYEDVWVADVLKVQTFMTRENITIELEIDSTPGKPIFEIVDFSKEEEE